MKKITLLIFIVVFSNCQSVEQYNSKINDLIAAEKLQGDVDFTYQKLQSLQPKLYWYIAKEKLDFKFDSLKKSIQNPMTSFDFYKKLAVVTNSIGQGHLYLYPKTKRYSKKQTKTIAKKGIGPLSQFEFEVFNDKLYVVKNKSYNKKIKIGAEVVSINNENSSSLLTEFKKFFTSDGYNKTLQQHGLSKRFSTFYGNKYGILDSLKYEFKNGDSIKTMVIKRKNVDSILNPKPKIILTQIQKEAQKQLLKTQKKAKAEKDYFRGYDKENKRYNRNLTFQTKDSSIAVIKINGFSIGGYRNCYKTFFEKIKAYKSKTLILDLRNNGGGRLAEIENLYSYLAENDYIFTKPAEVASKTSMFQMNYFSGSPLWLKPLQIAAAPIFYPFLFFKVRKGQDGKWYTNRQGKPKKLAENNFKGKIYVLINGGSFSASSIISSNLKGSKRAYFVGEETGGAYNGTVAGQMPLVKLPNSEVKIRIGLIVCTPFFQTEQEGRGIFPDTEIIPTVKNRVEAIDPEMAWILKDISK